MDSNIDDDKLILINDKLLGYRNNDTITHYDDSTTNLNRHREGAPYPNRDRGDMVETVPLKPSKTPCTCSIFNLSAVTLYEDLIEILDIGLNFILTPPTRDGLEHTITNVNDFVRTLELRMFFQRTN